VSQGKAILLLALAVPALLGFLGAVVQRQVWVNMGPRMDPKLVLLRGDDAVVYAVLACIGLTALIVACVVAIRRGGTERPDWD
jgi:hypothetical protein